MKLPDVLTAAPVFSVTTSTTNVQVSPGLMVICDAETFVAPATALVVPNGDAPVVQLAFRFGVGATRMDAGKLSVNAPLVAETRAVGLLMVSVRVDTPPCSTVLGENALENAGMSAGVMLIDATAGAVVPKDDA